MMYIERRPGQPVTTDMKSASNESVNRILRQQQVVEILTQGPMTAKEVAVEMWRRGYTTNDDRNNAAPRLTELCKLGIVEPVGSTICAYSGRRVTVFARRIVNHQEALDV